MTNTNSSFIDAVEQHIAEHDPVAYADAAVMATVHQALTEVMAEAGPVAVVDQNDFEIWADILPNASVKVGTKLFTAPSADERTTACLAACADEDIEYLRFIVGEGHTLRTIHDESLRVKEQWQRELNEMERERDERDARIAERCGCCGYLITESEHRGCLDSARLRHSVAEFTKACEIMQSEIIELRTQLAAAQAENTKLWGWYNELAQKPRAGDRGEL